MDSIPSDTTLLSSGQGGPHSENYSLPESLDQQSQDNVSLFPSLSGRTASLGNPFALNSLPGRGWQSVCKPSTIVYFITIIPQSGCLGTFPVVFLKLISPPMNSLPVRALNVLVSSLSRYNVLDVEMEELVATFRQR